jgi:hypothetical protein
MTRWLIYGEIVLGLVSWTEMMMYVNKKRERKSHIDITRKSRQTGQKNQVVQ